MRTGAAATHRNRRRSNVDALWSSTWPVKTPLFYWTDVLRDSDGQDFRRQANRDGDYEDWSDGREKKRPKMWQTSFRGWTRAKAKNGAKYENYVGERATSSAKTDDRSPRGDRNRQKNYLKNKNGGEK